MFNNASFIKAKQNFDLCFNKNENLCPMFRKSFHIAENFNKAELSFCALGIGYGYINGQAVSDELFAPPFSDYNKRLWYVTYDVTSLLKVGENNISFIVGNGFYNEDMPNDWGSEKASWRDQPKVIATLVIDGKEIVNTNDTFKCSLESPYVMNRLRNGVIYDARLYDNSWNTVSYDDSKWESAVIDDASLGEFSLCTIKGLKEFEVYNPMQVIKKNDGRVIFDFAYNHSGIIHFSTQQKSGDVITFRYCESLDGDLEPNFNRRMELPYHETDYAKDIYISDGKNEIWANRFAFFGFRFVEVTGLDLNTPYTIESVFVHQDVERKTSFECSDNFLNRLFECGIRSTYSNLFYNPIDCPTREKLGWMNDAQSSTEQFLTDFHMEELLCKWIDDMKDAMQENGELPAVVPTHGWGYEWGNGPVSDGSFFEIPYRIYLHSGNAKCLIDCLPYYKKYLEYLKSREDENGLINFGLYDWANSRRNIESTPRTLINALLRIKFNKIAKLASELSGEDGYSFEKEMIRQQDIAVKNFIDENGGSLIVDQTACAMLIYYGIGNKEKIGEQLCNRIAEEKFHHTCGMVGLRYLYMALNMINREDLAYKIITIDGYPSYKNWFLDGATTLYEYWDCYESKNHHMYSDVLSWMMKTIVGISPDENLPTFEKVEIKPNFFNGLCYAKGSLDSVNGEIKVEWTRENNKIELAIFAPVDNFVVYNGKYLSKGNNEFII